MARQRSIVFCERSVSTGKPEIVVSSPEEKREEARQGEGVATPFVASHKSVGLASEIIVFHKTGDMLSFFMQQNRFS